MPKKPTDTTRPPFASVPGWKPNDRERAYLELVISMSTDSIMGTGPNSRKAYTNNLRMIAKNVDDLQ